MMRMPAQSILTSWLALFQPQECLPISPFNRATWFPLPWGCRPARSRILRSSEVRASVRVSRTIFAGAEHEVLIFLNRVGPRNLHLTETL
jgi:hypothetical protein